ncbi:hypothetical protein OHB24_24245 [Kribbella sp. NBC_00482]|uniref:hypothetical protein n=1 Tax=Kribbella sp. NBC_00482 TaxID=2975968 RepID=UPI002E183CB2
MSYRLGRGILHASGVRIFEIRVRGVVLSLVGLFDSRLAAVGRIRTVCRVDRNLIAIVICQVGVRIIYGLIDGLIRGDGFSVVDGTTVVGGRRVSACWFVSRDLHVLRLLIARGIRVGRYSGLLSPLGETDNDVAELKRKAIRRLIRLIHDPNSRPRPVPRALRRHATAPGLRRTSRALSLTVFPSTRARVAVGLSTYPLNSRLRVSGRAHSTVPSRSIFAVACLGRRAGLDCLRVRAGVCVLVRAGLAGLAF